MATDAQIKANQRNTRRSTGPKTRAGKAKSRLNAVRHGLLAQQTVLPDEDGDEFDAFAAGLRDDLRPHGQLEELLCQRVILIEWRLARLTRIEAGLLTSALAAERAQLARDEAKRLLTEPLEKELNARILKAAKVATPLEYHEAQAAAEIHEELGMAESAMLGRAFAQEKFGANTLLLLARYETSLERSLLRALEALERQQKRRAMKAVDGAGEGRDD